MGGTIGPAVRGRSQGALQGLRAALPRDKGQEGHSDFAHSRVPGGGRLSPLSLQQFVNESSHSNVHPQGPGSRNSWSVCLSDLGAAVCLCPSS